MRWWRELLYVAGFYAVYSLVRSRLSGSSSIGAANAERIIAIERSLGLYLERSLQHAFLDAEWFIVFWNVFYGTLHFIVTIGVLVWLFRRFPERYRFWRTTLAVATACALIGFAFFPLTPPRLLPGYVDTLVDPGGLWSFDSGPMRGVANQHAAMPSLHIGWSLWCALAVATTTESRRVRMAIALHPLATLFAVIVTANHFWLDGVGGVAVVGVGLLAARALTPPRARDEDSADEDSVDEVSRARLEER
ncbi:MAG TPA: phosphatase PAP2 family protein [Acidimicrobiales bacterium]|nr:phosphatase PAP2 family protein [Acidimicrobiales bacterium]